MGNELQHSVKPRHGENSVCKREKQSRDKEQQFSRGAEKNLGIINMHYHNHDTVYKSSYRKIYTGVSENLFYKSFYIHKEKRVLSEVYANDTTNMIILQQYFVNFLSGLLRVPENRLCGAWRERIKTESRPHRKEVERGARALAVIGIKLIGVIVLMLVGKFINIHKYSLFP